MKKSEQFDYERLEKIGTTLIDSWCTIWKKGETFDTDRADEFVFCLDKNPIFKSQNGKEIPVDLSEDDVEYWIDYESALSISIGRGKSENWIKCHSIGGMYAVGPKVYVSVDNPGWIMVSRDIAYGVFKMMKKDREKIEWKK